MRVLVILRSAWRNDNNTGNTMTNFFSDIDAEFYSISLRDQKPQNDIAIKSYVVSESQIVKNIIKGTPTGIILDKENYDTKAKDVSASAAEGKAYNIAKKWRSYVFFYIRELIWITQRWKNERLDGFLKEASPDIIFMPVFNCAYPYRILKYVSKKTNARIILFHADDNYSLSPCSINPIGWAYRLKLRKYIREAVKLSSINYAISKVQQEEYRAKLNRNFKLLTKFENFDEAPEIKSELNYPLRFVFTGNISSNRWKMLASIAQAMKKINEKGVKAQLYIYSSTPMTVRMKKALDIPNTSFFMGCVPASEINDIQKNADVLVHAEAMDIKNKHIVHQSFSTKLVDYMKAARMIFAVGPSDAASIKHLKDNDAAVVVTDKKEIFNAIRKITENPSLISLYAEKGYECGRQFHNKNTMQKMIENDMQGIAENKA